MAGRCGAKRIFKSKRPKHLRLKFRPGEMARCCGAKQKCRKHHMLGPLVEVQMSKNRTPLWPEAHFHVRILKKQTGSGYFFEV